MDEGMVRMLKDRAGEAIDRHAGELREISIYLYENPELAYEERLAAKRLTHYLEEKGFDVERGIGGLETAFCATLESSRPGPAIAFLAEYDALPGVGHGCGHNLIAASALGAALGAKAVLDELDGKVVVMGTPAEEFRDQPEGKVKLLEAGQFEGLDACMMMHPSSSSASFNTLLAFIAVDVIFHGRTAHASSDPWNGRNALEGVILMFNHVSALRQHVRPDVRIHGIITDGGIVPNIIPERAAARFMLRAPKKAQVEELLTRFKSCAEGAAVATGTTVDVTIIAAVANLHPYPTMQALSRANFAALGEPLDPPSDSTGSTDFGDVSHACPCESFHIDLGAGDIPGHSRELAEATIKEPGIQSMLTGAKVLAMNAIDILADPSVLRRARVEMPESVGD